jgi:hypothetical protein
MHIYICIHIYVCIHIQIYICFYGGDNLIKQFVDSNRIQFVDYTTSTIYMEFTNIYADMNIYLNIFEYIDTYTCLYLYAYLYEYRY